MRFCHLKPAEMITAQVDGVQVLGWCRTSTGAPLLHFFLSQKSSKRGDPPSQRGLWPLSDSHTLGCYCRMVIFPKQEPCEECWKDQKLPGENQHLPIFIP